MTDNVISFNRTAPPQIQKDKLTPAKMIEMMIDLPLEGFLFVGWDTDGAMVSGSTLEDGGDILWLIEQFKLELLTGGYGAE